MVGWVCHKGQTGAFQGTQTHVTGYVNGGATESTHSALPQRTKPRGVPASKQLQQRHEQERDAGQSAGGVCQADVCGGRRVVLGAHERARRDRGAEAHAQ